MPKILKLSDNVRYVGVINPYGRTLAGMINPKLKPLLKSEQVKNEFFTVSTLMSLRNEVSSALGGLQHAILQHQKATVVVLHKKSLTYYVSVQKKEKDIEKIISLIKRII